MQDDMKAEWTWSTRAGSKGRAHISVSRGGSMLYWKYFLP